MNPLAGVHMLPSNLECPLAQVILEGRGVHLGIEVAWTMRARPDGAFCEQLTSKHWKSKLGYSGEAGSACWEVIGLSGNKRVSFKCSGLIHPSRLNPTAYK